MTSGFGVALTVVLLALNAFFVAAEFALVSARRAGVEPQAERGSRRAVTTLRAMENVSVMLAGAQLGITLCSVALGAVSEPAIAHLLEPLFHDLHVPDGAVHPVSFVIALLIVTLLHVVLGEMVPKNVALAGPERSAVWLAPVLAAAVRIARPVIWLLNGLANLTLRLVRVQARDEVASAFTRDEVADMVEESHRGGLLGASDRDLIGGALAFDRATAADVQLGLDRVHTLAPGATPADVEALAARTGFTRFPVRDDARLTGYVHLKDTLALPRSAARSALPGSAVRALPQVAPGDSLASAIDTMRAGHAHMAAVTSGDGVTVGIVTLDDVLRSIVEPI